jgi:hypothetical protein
MITLAATITTQVNLHTFRLFNLFQLQFGQVQPGKQKNRATQSNPGDKSD